MAGPNPASGFNWNFIEGMCIMLFDAVYRRRLGGQQIVVELSLPKLKNGHWYSTNKLAEKMDIRKYPTIQSTRDKFAYIANHES